MKKTTILFLDHTATMGGGEIALLRLVTSLDTRLFTPVVGLGMEGPLSISLSQAGIETHLIPLASCVRDARKETLGWKSAFRLGALFSLFASIWRLARFLKKRRVDIVHTNSLKADIIGGIAARLFRIPLVWHVRDRIAPDYLPMLIVRGFQFLSRRFPDHTIANSKATLDALGCSPSGNRSVIHDGIPFASRPSLASLSSLPIFGILGRITPWKGQHIFLLAAHLLRRCHPEVHYQIIGSALFGEDAYMEKLQRLVQILRLQDVVAFTGFQEDVPAAIAPLTCVVHASTIAEPFGQIVAEAMACGKAVIATKGGGVREIVVHRRTGLLVPMGDAETMAAAMETILRNPPLARRMGRTGQARIARRFTIEQTARKVEAIYAGLGEAAHAAN